MHNSTPATIIPLMHNYTTSNQEKKTTVCFPSNSIHLFTQCPFNKAHFLQDIKLVSDTSIILSIISSL